MKKVFLHHLTPLLTLKGFLPLWLTVLDLLRAYMHADNSENLYEAIPESLKNMLLVMASAGVLQPDSNLWTPTWRAIDVFLPGLKSELFPEPAPPPQQQSPPSASPPSPSSPQLSQSPPPTNQVTLSLSLEQLQQQVTYPKPIPPQVGSGGPVSPVSQSPPSDVSLSTSPRLPELLEQQQSVTPIKIIRPTPLVLDGKEAQQVINLVNQLPPSVASPVAIQPTAQLYRPVTQDQQQQQHMYQADFRQQQTISIGETGSPVKLQYAHLPQMQVPQDFHAIPYPEPVKKVADHPNQTEVA